MLEKLFLEMIAYYSGDPRRIQHFTKVHGFARRIGQREGLDAGAQEILEVAALTHDIGIRICEKKYGSAAGHLQEKEGPAAAVEMLTGLGYGRALVERVAYLIGRHHTYEGIEGLDYRILVEADFLVNLHEGAASPEAVRRVYRDIFRTEAGRDICRKMFGLTELEEAK